jgi:hypothetical protein
MLPEQAGGSPRRQEAAMSTSTTAAQLDELRDHDGAERAARRADLLREQRERLQTRHAHALSSLMGARRDLRGVHALADLVDDAVRWSA